VSVFPLGERHLKGLDEPERVYELEIEGVSATPAPEPEPEPAHAPPAKSARPSKAREKDIERRFEDFGYRLAESIQARVMRSLEGTLGKVGPPASSAEDDDLEDIVARAETFEERIRAQVEASLRASGIRPGERR